MAPRGIQIFFDDLKRSIDMREFWFYFALDDMVARYKRTLLGPLWNAAYVAATAAAFSLVIGGIFGQPIEKVVPIVLTGIVAWQLVGATVIESSSLLITSAHSIKSTNLPYFWFLWRQVARALFMFLHNFIPMVPLLLFFKIVPVYGFLLLASVPLATFAIAPWCMLIAMTCARFRDMQYFISNFSQMLFFATPVMWDDTNLTSGRHWLVEYNPFAYLVHLIKLPLLNSIPPMTDWIGALVIAIAGWLILFPFFTMFRNRIAFWV